MDAERERAVAEQRRRWDEVAAGWERWWDWIETATAEVNARLLELAGLEEGMRVLDVATGLGEPALSAARRVGPRGRVLGVDLAPGMLERAGRRARAAGLANLELEERDVQRLGLAGAGFDAAVCRFGLMLVHEPIRAAAGIRAALASGARLATAVWGAPTQTPFFELPARAMADVLGSAPIPAPDLAGEPGPTRLGEERLLETVLRQAGFEEIALERLRVRYRFASPAEFARMLEDISSRLREGLAGAPPQAGARFERRLEELLAPHRSADGGVVLDNLVLLARGRAPGPD